MVPVSAVSWSMAYGKRADLRGSAGRTARAEALRRLDGLRIVAERQLAIAPAPTAAAIAAAEAGDRSAWFREADEWAAERLATARAGRDQRGAPTAIRALKAPARWASGRAPPTRDIGAVAPAPLDNPALDEEHNDDPGSAPSVRRPRCSRGWGDC